MPRFVHVGQSLTSKVTNTSDGSDTRYFGCTAAACDALVLVPHIGMDP